jgi:hypothetical protein
VVTHIQGVPVSNVTPLLNQVLQFDGLMWVPKTLATAPIEPGGVIWDQGPTPTTWDNGDVTWEP